MRYFVLETRGEKMTNKPLEALETLPQIGISIGLPPYIVKLVDNIRGDIPRSAYLRKKIITIVQSESEKGGQNA